MLTPGGNLSGKTIRGYVFYERIASAGFGVVYRARQLAMDRDVAIKMIRPEYAQQPEFVQRFEYEARIIAKLEHPNIVPVHDYWRDDDGNAFIAMRFMRGGNLRGFLPKEGISLEMALRLVSQIGAALEFSHQQGVVHRDIKPDNILLDEEKNFYLSDFGIAKSLHVPPSLSITAEGIRFGTAAYASPEQWTSNIATPASDQYSFGIVIYEALTGIHPFYDAPMRQILQPLPLIAVKRTDIPPALDDVLRRANAKTPTKRYTDMRGFVAAFRRAAGEPMVESAQASRPVQPAADGEASSRFIIEENTPTERVQDAAPSIDENSALMLTTIHDVPHRAERLIGREALVVDLLAQLEQGEHLLLQGMGGIGKTSLAAETASRFIEKKGGISLWLYAGEQPPEALINALARAFDAQARITPLAGEAAASALRNLLSQREIKLIVIDNVWNETALKTILNALPREMPALITSRQRMAVGKIIDVSTLPPDQALALLGFHAGRTFGADDSAAQELCKLLGYHPFALEIAGKTLQVDDLTPSELIKQIASAPHSLRSPDSRGLSDQGSLADMLASSLNAMEDRDRFLFLTFGGLFAPRATAALLGRAANQDDAAVDEGLKVLVRRGLVKRTRTKAEIAQYYVHDLAYSYARAETTITASDAIAACSTYLVQRSDSFAPIDAEIDNLMGAAEAAQRANDDAALVNLIYHLAVMPPYFEARGYSPQVVALLEAAAEAAQRADLKREAHFLLSKLGNYYREERQDVHRALEAYEKALDMARQIGNPYRTAWLMVLVGTTRWLIDRQSPVPAYDAAQQLAEASGEQAALAVVYSHRGIYEARKDQPDFAAGRAYFEQAARYGRDHGMYDYTYNAILNSANCELELGNLDSAKRLHTEALEMAVDRDDYWRQAFSLWSLGEVYHALKDRQQAQDYLSRSLMLAKTHYFSSVERQISQYMQENQYVLETESA